jgi:hypothetical protein
LGPTDSITTRPPRLTGNYVTKSSATQQEMFPNGVTAIAIGVDVLDMKATDILLCMVTDN